jgi:hypothetical protein
MNLETTNRASTAAVGFIAAIVFFVVLGVFLKFAVIAPPVDAERAGVRLKALSEMRAAEQKSLETAGWVDEQRGIVRLPIETAVQQAAQAWQNPEQARADLKARAEKAAAPAPVTPPKPSAFE